MSPRRGVTGSLSPQRSCNPKGLALGFNVLQLPSSLLNITFDFVFCKRSLTGQWSTQWRRGASAPWWTCLHSLSGQVFRYLVHGPNGVSLTLPTTAVILPEVVTVMSVGAQALVCGESGLGMCPEHLGGRHGAASPPWTASAVVHVLVTQQGPLNHSIYVPRVWRLWHQAHGKGPRFHSTLGPANYEACLVVTSPKDSPTGTSEGLRAAEKKEKRKTTSLDSDSYLALSVFLSICSPQTSCHSIPSP